MHRAKRAMLALGGAAFAAPVVICSYLAASYPNIIYLLLWVVIVPPSLIASLGMLRIAIRWEDRAKL
jgi:hypothetical protein